MPTGLNRSRVRHVVPASTGRSDCVICAKENPKDPPLNIIQVIEGLLYNTAAHIVRVLLWFIVENTSDKAVRFRVIHRGAVTGQLRPFPFRPRNPRDKILRQLYSRRFCTDDNDPFNLSFYRRVNCTGLDPDPLRLSLGGTRRAKRLRPEIPIGRGHAPFTSFLTPEVHPGEPSIWLLDLKLQRATYDRLVGDHGFSVDSYARIKRDILTYELSGISPHSKFFDRHIAPDDLIVVPMAYDIAIFQDLGTPVAVEYDSMYVTPVRPVDDFLASRVLWFLGESADEFFLSLKYAASDDSPRPDPIVLDWDQPEAATAEFAFAD
jgi:hypothetical protein